MRLSWLALALLGVGLPLQGDAAVPLPVKATPADEIDPVAGAQFFVWSKSKQRSQHFDLYLQRGKRTIRVNPAETQAFAGGTDGTRIAYLQMRGNLRTLQESLHLYNLARGTRTALHPQTLGVNGFDPPSIARGKVIYGYHGFAFAAVVTYDLRTGKTVTLEHQPVGVGPSIASVHAAGRYIAWIDCQNRCDLLEYSSGVIRRLATGVLERFQATAVLPDGTVYVSARSSDDCGPPVTIWRYGRDGLRSFVLTLPQGFSIQSMYASAQADGTTRLFFDRGRCTMSGLTTMDIYSLTL